MENPKRYKVNPVVSFRDEGDDGALLYNPDTDDSAIINPTGRSIWNLLATPRTLDEIAAHLTATFRNVSGDQAAKDATQFIEALSPDFVLEVSGNV
jgi:hypothetical protein